ncbi:hypothetical protein NG798_07685 [Ancylothrix sp. C2]|uniref:hypothetical protein n=1 Tax=Ancylothrix sp. D3o TaxID=2953691 RepID=UPI0021BAA3C9|nr:hypothetical protein [Ancylothrix sp. D3o]MCT7949664.1 hypothetical protein [Ancylothrix sp. D3o]
MKTNNLDWLQIAEYLSISGSLIGSVASLASQQVIYAAVPLSLSLTLNLFNRQRTENLTRTSLTAAVTHLDQKLSSINSIVNERVFELKTDIAQLNEQAQKIQANQDLESLTSSLLNLQQKCSGLEQSITSLNSQMEKLTEQTKMPSQNSLSVRSTELDEYQSPPDPTLIRTLPIREPENPTAPQDIVRKYHW